MAPNRRYSVLALNLSSTELSNPGYNYVLKSRTDKKWDTSHRLFLIAFLLCNFRIAHFQPVTLQISLAPLNFTYSPSSSKLQHFKDTVPILLRQWQKVWSNLSATLGGTNDVFPKSQLSRPSFLLGFDFPIPFWQAGHLPTCNVQQSNTHVPFSFELWPERTDFLIIGKEGDRVAIATYNTQYFEKCHINSGNFE